MIATRNTSARSQYQRQNQAHPIWFEQNHRCHMQFSFTFPPSRSAQHSTQWLKSRHLTVSHQTRFIITQTTLLLQTIWAFVLKSGTLCSTSRPQLTNYHMHCLPSARRRTSFWRSVTYNFSLSVETLRPRAFQQLQCMKPALLFCRMIQQTKR